MHNIHHSLETLKHLELQVYNKTLKLLFIELYFNCIMHHSLLMLEHQLQLLLDIQHKTFSYQTSFIKDYLESQFLNRIHTLYCLLNHHYVADILRFLQLKIVHLAHSHLKVYSILRNLQFEQSCQDHCLRNIFNQLYGQCCCNGIHLKQLEALV